MKKRQLVPLHILIQEAEDEPKFQRFLIDGANKMIARTKESELKYQEFLKGSK